jgi:hypothetical protein
MLIYLLPNSALSLQSLEKPNLAGDDYDAEMCCSSSPMATSFLTLNVEDLKGTLERLERMQEKSRPASAYYAPDYADLLSPKSGPWSPVLRRSHKATPAPELGDLSQDQLKSTLEYGDLQLPSPRLQSPIIPPSSPVPECGEQSGAVPEQADVASPSPEHQEVRAAAAASTAPASPDLNSALGRPKTS